MVLLFLLAILIGLSVIRLFDAIVPAVLASPSGLVDLFASTASTLFGVSRDAIVVVPVGMFVGLVALLAKDQYKYMYAYLLTGGSVLGFLVLIQQSIIISPTEWEWASNLPFLALGIALGFVFGGWRWDGLLPIRPTTYSHDYLQQSSRVGGYEFDKALPRLLWLTAALLVFLLFERTVQYSLVPPEFIGLDLQGFGTNLLSVLLLLGILAGVRSYTRDTSTMLFGPTGSGKSTVMAGLSYTGPRYTKVTTNDALTTLTDVFVNDGFHGVSSQDTGEAIPVQFTYKHGFLFPRKVTVSAVDYAGEHVPYIQVPEDETDVVTSSFDEAFDVARNIRWTVDQEADDDMTTYIDSTVPVGIDMDDDRFEWPSRVKERGSKVQPKVVRKLIEDMLFHADSIGLILPMDDFSGRAVDEGLLPDWVTINSSRDGDIRDARPREDRDRYLRVYTSIEDNLVDEYGKDVFYLFSQADLAIKSYQNTREEDLWQPLLSEPTDFQEYLVRDFLPDVVWRKLSGFDFRTNQYEPDDVFPVNFAVEEADDDAETPVELQDKPELFGTQALLERIGRD